MVRGLGGRFMQLAQQVKGKWYAAMSLAMFTRYFRNWREVWAAYRSDQPLPPLVLRSGPTINHLPGDEPLLIFREIYLEKCYTGDDFYRPKPTDTVVDIGGNIGVFAVFLQDQYRGIRVHCFEPSSETRSYLTRNVQENGFGDAVTIHPLAVGDREQKVELKLAPNSGHRSLFSSDGNEGGQVEEVDCITLDQALTLTGADRIDLLKIDTEGAEIEIVEGATPAAWSRVDRVIAEYHDMFRPGCRDRVVKALEAAGYEVVVKPFPGDTGLGTIEAKRPGK